MQQHSDRILARLLRASTCPQQQRMPTHPLSYWLHRQPLFTMSRVLPVVCFKHTCRCTAAAQLPARWQLRLAHHVVRAGTGHQGRRSVEVRLVYDGIWALWVRPQLHRRHYLHLRQMIQGARMTTLRRWRRSDHDSDPSQTAVGSRWYWKASTWPGNIMCHRCGCYCPTLVPPSTIL